MSFECLHVGSFINANYTKNKEAKDFALLYIYILKRY